MKDLKLTATVTTNVPLLPEQKIEIERTINGTTCFVVDGDGDTTETGYPFIGYPNKYKRETWKEWEKRVEKAGFNLRFLQPGLEAEPKFERLTNPYERERDDWNAKHRVTPNSHQYGLD